MQFLRTPARFIFAQNAIFWGLKPALFVPQILPAANERWVFSKQSQKPTHTHALAGL